MELHEATPNPQAISRWPIFVFLGSAVICLLSSTIFHLFHPMSVSKFSIIQKHMAFCSALILQELAYSFQVVLFQLSIMRYIVKWL
jgi:predicted membrane channel-forming protein YqfA (hemolysin III family)